MTKFVWPLFLHMSTVQSFIFGPFQENTYVVYDESTKGAIVDPGCYHPQEQAKLVEFVESKGLQIEMIVNTHCHIDHVLGNQFTKTHFGVPLLIPEKEIETYRSVKVYAANYGFPGYQEAEVDGYLTANEPLNIGNNQWEVIFVPGHSPGHLAFYHPQAKICLAGDVLFNGSIGRTDLPGGDYQTLIDSIQGEIFKLDDEVVVYSGHGPVTTVGHEKKTNPFCAIQ